MKNIKYHLELGVVTDFTKSKMKATKGLGQRNSKVDANDFLIFNIWSTSNILYEISMDFGADIIGMV